MLVYQRVATCNLYEYMTSKSLDILVQYVFPSGYDSQFAMERSTIFNR